jgi:hypothetical protein
MRAQSAASTNGDGAALGQTRGCESFALEARVEARNRARDATQREMCARVVAATRESRRGRAREAWRRG